MNQNNEQKHSGSPPKRGKAKTAVAPEIQSQILELHRLYGSREIARRVGYSRKIVRRVLLEHGSLAPAQRSGKTSKLDPFRTTIKEKAHKGLTVTRILREIREQGYSGGRSILAEHVRALRASEGLQPQRTVKRRFETRPGEEMQIDWSPFRGRPTTVHVLGCLLCASRKLWCHAYRNERQSTLLEALSTAFQYFGGCCLRVVLDNMATAVLAHYGPDGNPIWHPTFLDFARHYGFQPFACAIRDADRKGKKEKSFRLLWDDFLKATEFGSLEDLNHRLKIWLDDTPHVGNQRVHGTTRLVPNQQWLSERQFLIRLPENRFPVYRQSARVVDQDATLSIDGTRYTVPSSVASRSDSRFEARRTTSPPPAGDLLPPLRPRGPEGQAHHRPHALRHRHTQQVRLRRHYVGRSVPEALSLSHTLSQRAAAAHENPRPYPHTPPAQTGRVLRRESLAGRRHQGPGLSPLRCRCRPAYPRT